MNESRREILLGYLSGALDEDERRQVQQELERNESFRIECAALRKKVRPLSLYAQWTEQAYKPPEGLAKRTCQRIWLEMDGNRQTTDSRLGNNCLSDNVSTLSIPPKRNSPRLDREFHRNFNQNSKQNSRQNSKRRKWRATDIFSAVCLGITILLLVFPTFQFVKNQIVQIVRQKTVKRIADNTVAMSQIHEGYLFYNETENLGDFIVASVGGTDLGSFLASFGETNLSQKTLNYFPPEKEAGKFSVSPQSSVSTLIGRFPIHSSQSPGSLQYAQSFPYPQISHLFDPLATVFSRFPEERPEFTFVEWDGISAPVFAGVGEKKSNGTLIHVSNEQNLIYRDGRVFFRKP